MRPARGLSALETRRGTPEGSVTEIAGILLGALLDVLTIVAWTLLGTRRELGELRTRPPASDPAPPLLKQELDGVRRERREDQEQFRRGVATLTTDETR